MLSARASSTAEFGNIVFLRSSVLMSDGVTNSNPEFNPAEKVFHPQLNVPPFQIAPPVFGCRLTWFRLRFCTAVFFTTLRGDVVNSATFCAATIYNNTVVASEMNSFAISADDRH